MGCEQGRTTAVIAVWAVDSVRVSARAAMFNRDACRGGLTHGGLPFLAFLYMRYTGHRRPSCDSPGINVGGAFDSEGTGNASAPNNRRSQRSNSPGIAGRTRCAHVSQHLHASPQPPESSPATWATVQSDQTRWIASSVHVQWLVAAASVSRIADA